MDWLEGLSNIKGQISSLTKDLLTEGTSELSDPKSELDLARCQIAQLESVINTQKNEISLLKSKIDELQVKLESAELRLDHNRDQFQLQLREKETIIMKLRSEMSAERGEPEGQSAASNKSFKVGVTPEPLTHVEHIDSYLELASEDHDVFKDDGGDGTATWQDLKNEVAELRAEVGRWRRIAKQKKQKDKQLASLQDGNSQDLEREVEDLKQKLLDLEELRQTELTALRDSHTEHMNNLLDQLRETECEVLTLQSQLEEAAAQKDVEPSTVPTGAVNEKPTEFPSSPGPDRGPKKKQRVSKKRKQKLSAESRPPGSELMSTIPEPVIEKKYKEIAVQCLLLDFSTDTSTDFEKVDVPSSDGHTPSEAANSESRTTVTIRSVAVQREVVFLDKEIQTDSTVGAESEVRSVCTVDVNSVGVQALASDELVAHVSSLNTSVTNIDDGRSQISDVSDISGSSRYLDDLVHQLADEVQSYESVVDEVVHAISKRFPLTSADVNHCDVDVEDITQKLALFQTSLKQRRDQLATIRKRNRKRFTVTEQTQSLDREASGLSALSEMICSRSSSPVIPSVIPEPHDFETEDWRDEDFSDFSSKEVKQDRSQQSISSHGTENKAQIIHRSESSETIVADLRNTIQELETRLSTDAETYRRRIEAMEEAFKPAERLQHALNLAVQHLSTMLPGPPPLPPGSPLSKDLAPPPRDWPPKAPEAQLALIIGLERAASEQVQRLRVMLGNAEDSLNKIVEENSELHSQLDEFRESLANAHSDEKQSHRSGVLTDTDEEASTLARRLCQSLDPEYDLEAWDTNQWDYLLYEVLKTRFDESSTDRDNAANSASTDERVVQLSAEVAALRDILGQHAAFRSQAERDLRQLLGTVTSQRAQVDELTAENKRLECALADSRQHTEQPIHSREDESNELNSTAIHHLSELVREKDEEVERLKRQCVDLKQLIRSAYNMTSNLSDPSSSATSAETDEDVTVVLERLTQQWSEAKSRADRAEAMYESVLSALEQKHSESQAYHTELQRVYKELNSSSMLCKTLQEEVNNLRARMLSLTQETVRPECEATERVQSEADVVASTEVPVCSSVAPNLDTDNRESKLMAEVERLRGHLLEMEESYTTEALNAEAREVDLRDQLRRAQQRVIQLEESSQTAELRVTQAQAERDEALDASATCRKEIAALKINLANLQSVLDSFQQNQHAAITAETEHIRLELQRAQQNETALRSDINRLTTQMADYNQLEERSRQMTAQIQRHNSQMERIRAQVEERDVQIESLRTRLAQMAVDTDSKIEKILIKNLLLSYFQLPNSQKQNGLRVIGSLLHFTDEEYAKVGSTSGAIPTLLNWMRNAVSSLPAGPPKDVTFASSYPDKSFTELFLTFLEQEAGLRAPLRLSMDHYTPDTVSRESAPRRPSQPTSELESLHTYSRSNTPLLTTISSAAPITVRTPESAFLQSSSKRDSKIPLNPLFQM